MVRKSLSVLACIALSGAVTLSGIRHLSAGEIESQAPVAAASRSGSPAPVLSATLLDRRDTQPEASPADTSSGASGDKLLPPGRSGSSAASPQPDQNAMDQILIHGWAGALYQNHRPKLKHAIATAPYLALTFDDGPKPWGTPLVLEILRKHNAHATFFLVGKQCARFPALVSRIVADGHEIGNHTYSHHRLPTIPLPAVAQELERNRSLVRQLTGHTMFLFRPPGGQTNDQIQTLVDSLGYTTVFWTVDSGELRPNMSPEKVFHTVVSQVANGDIILLHNGDPNIVTALPQILDVLSQRGFQFVTVSELMQLTGGAAVDETASTGTQVE